MTTPSLQEQLQGPVDNAGIDFFNGGPGFDTISFEFLPFGITFTVSALGGATERIVIIPDELEMLYQNIESHIFTPFDDNVTLSDEDDLAFALAGDDIVHGSGGNDTIQGGPGDDFIDGGADLDIISFADGGSGIVFTVGDGGAGVTNKRTTCSTGRNNKQ